MVLLVTSVKLDMPVTAAFVLEKAAAEGTTKRELVAMALLVALEEA